MPAEPIHTDPEIWGEDAKMFNPYRFLKHTNGLKADGSKVHPAAFRGFGSGATICPGRYLALMEIGSVVAMFVERFEVEPIDGRWEVESGKVDDVISNAIRPPEGDVEVLVTERR